MIKILRIPALLFMLLVIASCSSDDSGTNYATPDSLTQTEWEHQESNRGYYIYFSVGDEVRINHPYYDVVNESWYNEDIYGTYTYDKPNVTMSFTGDCYQSGFVFSDCDVTGTVDGIKLKVHDDGDTYSFTNMYPDE